MDVADYEVSGAHQEILQVRAGVTLDNLRHPPIDRPDSPGIAKCTRNRILRACQQWHPTGPAPLQYNELLPRHAIKAVQLMTRQRSSQIAFTDAMILPYNVNPE
jgi:hypothetical protein